ncbi:MAG: polysaccharide deacetylase family protein [Saprospiraceae bacterium]|nr:polysaccharide deacetylase family protein [Saprospiraceae bacterium]
MYLVKTPEFIQNLFPNFTWKIPTQEKKIFLTFDDGPIPEVTPWVIGQLAKYEAKATFFCVGENVQRHPGIFLKLRNSGHAVASHTNNHLSGWRTDNIPYFHNVRRGATLVKSPIFRPPYGRIKPSQVPFLMRHYHIIMWDVLSGDFDPKISADQCLSNVIDHADSGSIIVFHDSLKAKEKLQFVLPRVLQHFSSRGYDFDPITESVLFVPSAAQQRA